MKELSIEEKAKAYDGAIEKMQSMMKSWETLSYNGKTFLQDIKYIFPELKESEDEKIRKAMIEGFEYYGNPEADWWIGIKVKDCIAYLEKQGEKGINGKNREIPFSEQKPAWSEEDDDNLSWLVEMLLGFDGNDIECYKDKKFIDKCKEVCKWLKAIKDRTSPQPKQEWGEEDKDKLNRIYSILGQAADTHAFSTTCRLIGDRECIELQDFLKFLRPQNAWKPSDEQMKALWVTFMGGEEQAALASLYNDLKKLK